MSYCVQEGKDRVIFLSKEDASEPSTIQLSENSDDEEPGAILPNGEINWGCPCLGGYPTGPCSVPFRDAFSCMVNNGAEKTPMECGEAFDKLEQCMAKFPGYFRDVEAEEEQDDNNSNAQLESATNKENKKPN